jgi:hypothetical protein
MEGPLRLADYLADPWLHKRTNQPHLDRDPSAENAAVQRYLDEQPDKWHDLIRTYSGEVPPLPSDHRIVIFLIAGNEAALIERCLDAIAADLVSSALHRVAEVVVVCQHLAGAPCDETSDLVRYWSMRHRGSVTVHLIDVEWPAGCCNFLALSRKLAVDVVAQRMLNSRRVAPLYLITEDADIEWIERGRARHVVDTFDANPTLDVLRGWHLRSLELLEYLPLFVERLTWRACEHALSDPELRPERNAAYEFAWNRVVTAGWNVAFTLEAYVLAGGYTRTVELFEDMDLGQRISVMRGAHTSRGFVPCTTTAAWMPFEASSDGRRALTALIEDTDIYGTAPSLSGFVKGTAQARSWSMAEASEAARQRPPDDAVDRVLRRRRAEIAAILGDNESLELVMGAAQRELAIDQPCDTIALAARQRAFLSSARLVSAGMPSRAHVDVLRRSTIFQQPPEP